MGQEPKRQPQVVDRVSMVSFTLRDLLVYFLRLGTLGFGGPIALAGHMQKDLSEETGSCGRSLLQWRSLQPGPSLKLCGFSCCVAQLRCSLRLLLLSQAALPRQCLLAE